MSIETIVLIVINAAEFHDRFPNVDPTHIGLKAVCSVLIGKSDEMYVTTPVAPTDPTATERAMLVQTIETKQEMLEWKRNYAEERRIPVSSIKRLVDEINALQVQLQEMDEHKARLEFINTPEYVVWRAKHNAIDWLFEHADTYDVNYDVPDEDW